MSEKICTKMIRVIDPPDAQGRPQHHHERCKSPGAEYTIGGLLAQAKAILCDKHKLAADKETFTSKNGYALGKIGKAEKENRYQQERLPGTGVQ